jgi:glycosyltransferase involved in cell wall biosynthesis
MRIVHAVYSLDMGGAEVIVTQLCRIQRAQGHQVAVLAYSRLGVLGEQLKAEGFPIYVPGEAHPLKTMARYLRYLLREEPDVVHCHNVAPTIQAAPPAWLAGVRRVITTRHRLELHPYDAAQEAKYNLMGWLCDWINGICQVTCDNLLLGRFARKDKIVLVYNGTTPVERVAPHPGKRGLTLLFVGRLVREKDLATLIRAVAQAAPRLPDLDAWIVGGGAERPNLEALAGELGVAERVRFWGQQTVTAPFFCAADVFVMSSISEGLPMSLLQSMSLGTPSILTDVDGMGEILRLTGGGLLTPVGDPAAFAAAIVRMASEPGLREQLSRCALEAYRNRFTLEEMNEGYMRLYRS